MVKKVPRSAEKFSEPFPLSLLPLYHSKISITIRLPFVSRYTLAEVLGSGVVGTHKPCSDDSGVAKRVVFQKGGFGERALVPVFRSGGNIHQSTLVPVFVPGQHPNVTSFRFSFWGNIRQHHRFGKPPFANPLMTPRS